MAVMATNKVPVKLQPLTSETYSLGIIFNSALYRAVQAWKGVLLDQGVKHRVLIIGASY